MLAPERRKSLDRAGSRGSGPTRAEVGRGCCSGRTQRRPGSLWPPSLLLRGCCRRRGGGVPPPRRGSCPDRCSVDWAGGLRVTAFAASSLGAWGRPRAGAVSEARAGGGRRQEAVCDPWAVGGRDPSAIGVARRRRRLCAMQRAGHGGVRARHMLPIVDV